MERLAARVKLSDVARHAGVSAATVSRVLSNPDLVAESTRTTVLQAVEATGYRMNHAARNLRKQRTGSVVALVPNLSNPFFAKILDGMGHELARAGYDLLVADTLEDKGRHTALQRFLDPSRSDGVILLDGMVALPTPAEQADLPPIVTACEWIEGTDVPRIVLDNREGGVLAIRHLRDLGHDHIGLIGGPPRNVLHLSRLEGAKDAAGTARITLFDGDFTLSSGQAAAKVWMDRPPLDRPSGIFAFSDEMACAFMATLQRAGYIVPRDVSIVGFDDIDLASYLAPALTTVRQPKREIGRKAAQLILQRIAGESIATCTMITPRLMVRETTESRK
ncbi:LacI family DNA-binding transcriptional regulator [Paracoccus aestuariivivens]|uniref:LacI family DNA-binding transcriptional regulator n=1 Tax=Paracoccus aestuariivivens TaxID=1820333 RepID=A0A6L6J7A6_9RHOB|nr:LacI family DNA-binding transcriptional regulator [Paracoccus aestuariivivens]MTH77065.1 LacI family DNA-binding transcriptional regulator [Paracoccus aestuariivivens]